MWYFMLLIFLVHSSKTNGLFTGPAVYRLNDPLLHGECPTWDSRTNTLYYVDILQGTIFKYKYSTNKTESITLNGLVAPIVPSKYDPNVILIGLNRSVVALKWNKDGTFTKKTLVTVSDDYPESNFNDGKADKKGNLWWGTMGKKGDTGTPNQGKLYKISHNGSIETLIAPVNISNGMAWNAGNNRYYYIDSPTLQIWEFDHDGTNGLIANKKVAFDLKVHGIEGHPDGMTIDKDENLWVALYGGGSVIKINPSDGTMLERVPIPASCVTSVMWGGPVLDILFVTTSKKSLNEKQKNEQPGAGSVYAVANLGTAGVPVFEADVKTGFE